MTNADSMPAIPTTDAVRPVALTGDRATGPLHLGHYAGSLRTRVALQDTHRQYLLIADMQALTDTMHDPAKVGRMADEIVLDYLAVGIDPDRTTICLQSALPALAELTMLYLNLVSVARLERNPTVKEEIGLRGFGRAVPAGFLCYPVSQAADITAFRATAVPVGSDQLPMIEQTNEIVRSLNRLCGTAVLPEARAVLSGAARLPGIDGTGKMSKSRGNAIALSASPDAISQAVRAMFTDPAHIRAEDPGRVDGNVVFSYLDAFDPDADLVADLKDRYRRGGLGDSTVKRRLDEVLQEALRPIRERRKALAADPAIPAGVLARGTQDARQVTGAVARDVRRALGLRLT